MRNLLLSTVTLLVVPAVAIAAPNFSSHTHTTPIELKPISSSGLKLASVCFLGYGECDDVGFGKGDENYTIDTEIQCINEGYTKQNCNSVQEIDGVCPYNPAYGRGCKCVSNLISCPAGQVGNGDACEGKYASCKCDPALISCSSNKVGSGASCGGKYETCVCKSEYMYTSSNCTSPRSVSGSSCDGKYTECSCPKGVDEGEFGCKEYYASPCSSVCKVAYPDNCHNRTDNNSQTYGCMKYYDDCSTKCETPYKDNCRNRTEITVPANATCSTYFSDCSSKCSDWSCVSGYERSGSSCKQSCAAKFAYDSSNCSGEGMVLDGESCDGKYTACKKFAKILYSDRTTSYDDILTKTPIGVVVDENKKLAVSLNFDSSVYNVWQAIAPNPNNGLSWEDLTFYDIPAVENCTSTEIFQLPQGWITNPQCLNRDGKSDTAKIAAYAKSSGIEHPSTDFVLNYVPPQVSSPASWFAKGQWFLASVEDFLNIEKNYEPIYNTFEKLDKSRSSKMKVNSLRYVTWYSSTEQSASQVWKIDCNSSSCRVYYVPKDAAGNTSTSSGRPFIYY